jgi:aspartyl-tRNA(Asn)/glutamyl-tRNA(Gln) amidotransferase subunit A
LPQTIREVSERIRAREISPLELTRCVLDRIERLDPDLNAFITVTADLALEQARIAEEEIQRGGYRGALHGIPVGLKDLIDTAGIRTTAASALFRDRIPAEDACVVRRLRDAGAVILGKQNLHEFAYGGSCMVSYFGEVRNPWDLKRITGGSSGGSAASVAAGLGLAGIGTDTAGSVRVPAAYCGVVGLKPTYGCVDARGVIPLSWSYDHVGPITNCVYDAALMLQVMAGSSAERPVDFAGELRRFVEKPEASTDGPRLRIGIPRNFFFDNLDTEIAGAAENAIQVFRAMGCEIRDEIRLDVPTDRTLSSAESWAYHREYVARSPELYQAATLMRIQSGKNISTEGGERARQELAASRDAIKKVFQEADVLLTPTVPIPPPSIVELKDNPEKLRPVELTMLRNTRPFNVWGVPALSIPCGITDDGLPIGLQLAAQAWREGTLLRAAYAYDKAMERQRSGRAWMDPFDFSR